MKFKPFLFLICLFHFSNVQAQIFVNVNASGANDGSSWADAYSQIFDAIAAAEENAQIWIASGLYLASENDSTYLTPAYGVSLYGGFAGAEASIEERDWAANLTIISGDLNQDDVAGDFVTNRIENSRHLMLIQSGLDNTTILDGLIFENGQTLGADAGGDDRRGGAILAYGAPVIRNCIFRNNYGYFGGACYPRFEEASGSVFENCSFNSNSASSGGALYINSLDTASFINLVFNGNRSASNGGAVYHQATKGYWSNCDFDENQCGSDNRGGAIYSTNSELLINDGSFTSNQAFRTGGAIHMYNDGDTLYSYMNNCVFNDNASRWGGGVTIYDSLNFVRFSSCDFSNNLGSASGGAMSIGFQSTVALFDCFFDKNNAEGSGGAIFCQNENTVLLCDSTDFITNVSTGSGGAISAASGQQIEMKNSYLESNSGSIGGAIHMGEDSMDLANLTLVACIMLGNVADSQGGGLNVSNSDVFMLNCLVAFNFADGLGTGGGISQNVSDTDSDSMLIVHSTIANNIGALSAGIAQWTDGNDTTDAKVYLMNSILSNDGLNHAVEDGSPDFISYGGNLSSDESLVSFLIATNDVNDLDAKFVDDEDFDWHLTQESPAIDKAIDSPLEVDLDGNLRSGIPDIGAYEYQGLVSLNQPQIEGFDIKVIQQADQLRIKLNGSINGAGQFVLYQSNGSLVKKARFAKQLEGQEFDLDLYYLPTGLYYLSTKIEDKNLGTISVFFLND